MQLQGYVLNFSKTLFLLFTETSFASYASMELMNCVKFYCSTKLLNISTLWQYS
jgi:hypothetical protein